MKGRATRARSRAGAKLLLVTNDDGVRAEGLIVLAARLKGLGRVVVVAPDQQRSAASHSITLHRPLRINKLSPDVYEVDGTPTDCVMLGINEILKARPDIIVSGVNHGANIGDDVHYSGTVSAAFEGGILGIPSIAVSLATNGLGNFAAAAGFAAKVARKVLAEGLPKGIILNINVPDLRSRDIKRYIVTKQGKRNYGSTIIQKLDPRGKKYYWIGGDEASFEDISDSDCNAIRDGRVSITPLRVNMTDGDSLAHLARWKF